MLTLFLDIDGCLNKHIQQANGYCGIDIDNRDVFNAILMELYCKYGFNVNIVIISAWRYMILSKTMTLRGFISLLLTHGISNMICNYIKDIIPEDIDIGDVADRAKLCIQYIIENNIDNYLIIDDLDLGYTEFNMNFHKVDGARGLTQEDKTAILARFP